MFYARRDYLVITCVDDEPPVEHKLRRGVTVLAKICEVERRGSRAGLSQYATYAAA